MHFIKIALFYNYQVDIWVSW